MSLNHGVLRRVLLKKKAQNRKCSVPFLVAERVRFELTRSVTLCSLSKGVPSTTRPSLQPNFSRLQTYNKAAERDQAKFPLLFKHSLIQTKAASTAHFVTRSSMTRARDGSPEDTRKGLTNSVSQV